MTLDPGLFKRAVECIDRGDISELQRMLSATPELAMERLDGSPDWLREQAGDALDGFFRRPYLLWFVAEDPVRRDTLPHNIVDVVHLIVDHARASGADSLQEQLDFTLRLVCWSGVAARLGLQIAMIDALLDVGALPGATPNDALVNGHARAAEHLVQRGAILTLGTAVCLARWSDAENLFAEAAPAVRQFALVLAALNGRAEAVSWLLARGVPANEPSTELYSHGTPLHHAVSSGSLETVKVLVEAGADVARVDTLWKGTPLGWADHYAGSTKPSRQQEYATIAGYLRQYPQIGAHP